MCREKYFDPRAQLARFQPEALCVCVWYTCVHAHTCECMCTYTLSDGYCISVCYLFNYFCWIHYQFFYVTKTLNNWVPVAHTCNPSYSGGRDQEDHSLKSAWANSLWDPILKKPSQKKGWWNGSQCIGPEFKPQYRKRKGKNKTHTTLFHA
jgi:hypothetical protein